MKMLLGPLLGYEQNEIYTVCFLSSQKVASPDLMIAGQAIPFTQIANTPSGIYWRAEATVAAAAAANLCQYTIQEDGLQLEDQFARNEWSFYVPGIGEEPKIAYATCNGFSNPKLRQITEKPYELWKKMATEHNENIKHSNPKKKPYSLLLMGGDQIYADDLWQSDSAKTIKDWSHLTRKEQQGYPVNPTVQQQLDKFYEQAYIKGWGADSDDMALMLASIPSVMMWDDHDIFDGWGSYRTMADGGLHDSPIYQEIFKYAKKYFELFQVRSLNNHSLFDKTGVHYAFGLTFRDYFILGLDNRTERTQTLLMGEGQWQAVKTVLETLPLTVERLLVMVGLPLVYRDFSAIDSLLQATPWQEELEDDAHDHWSVKAHQGDRIRLIQILLDNFIKKNKNRKTVILSGDVHVGALGLIKDEINQLQITQVIASAIVHPAPNLFEWAGISATTPDEKQRLGKGDITIEVIQPIGSEKYIKMRNYATLEKFKDNDNIWINWICESERKLNPEYPV
jgi:hypothetical protein